VHVKRDIHQQKHAVFEGSSEEVKEMANTVTAMIEMVKNHSTTVACADLGKQMIQDYLHNLGQLKAADYLARHHLRNVGPRFFGGNRGSPFCGDPRLPPKNRGPTVDPTGTQG